MVKTSTRSTGGLLVLVDGVRSVVAQRRPPQWTAGEVAALLRLAVRSKDLLTPEHVVGSPDDYTQHVLHVEPDGSFSVVGLVWLPGQCTPVHDHVSWCSVGVYRGQETEVRYRLAGEEEQRYLVPIDESINPAGSVCGIAPPGDIHKVWNSGPDTAVSVHVYGADIGRLGSSIRRRYDCPVARS